MLVSMNVPRYEESYCVEYQGLGNQIKNIASLNECLPYFKGKNNHFRRVGV